MNIMLIKKIVYIAMFIFLYLISYNCFAKVYKWVDENGKMHYSDKPLVDKSGKKAAELKLNIDMPKNLQSQKNQSITNSCENTLNNIAWQECQVKKLIAEETRRKNRELYKKKPLNSFKNKQNDQSINNEKKITPLTLCQEAKKDYRALTEVTWKGGVRHFNALEENGKVASQERKDEVINELKTLLNSYECKNE